MLRTLLITALMIGFFPMEQAEAGPYGYGPNGYRKGGPYRHAAPYWRYGKLRPGYRIARLPAFATTVVMAGVTYHVVDGTYFRRHGGQYVVVSQPPVVHMTKAEKRVKRAKKLKKGKLLVYPLKGQSKAKRKADRAACNLWAQEETGHEPDREFLTKSDKKQLHTAKALCLKAKGYAVQ
uniref:Uncharacterized protein n=1 Tax=Magnetococcus massalia (strain MO-1) TaxID=451514 RepID=A0A1S7LM62_MAGMO|nr:Exported protein of unknown function, putative signal peptide [Candidatus Magnetococcus massalia]